MVTHHKKSLQKTTFFNSRSHSVLFVTIALSVIVGFLLMSFRLDAAEDPVVKVFERVGKAVVNIRTEELTKTGGDDGQKTSPFKKYFKIEEQTEELYENMGSGVVLDPRGIIVTNEHLIAKAITIRVKFMGGKEYDAYVLASDPEYDIALLKIISGNGDFPYLTAGSRQKKVLVGEKAIVIGNPYGLSSSVTVGVVSFVGRNLEIDNRKYDNLIQTDAAINPGNSGGVLLDGDGNPLGIVTAIFGEGKGIGFAIPIEDVMTMLAEFLESSPRRPILGLFIRKSRDERGSFLAVDKVIPGSPAFKYGIKAGDKITELNKIRIRESTKLHSIIRSIKGNENVQLRITRDTKRYTMNIDADESQQYIPLPIDEVLCGMKVSDIKGYPRLKYRLRDRNGVVITKVFGEGIAEKSGLRHGDVITKINNNLIKGHTDFDSFMVEALKRNYILYQVKRDESLFYLPVKLDMIL